MKYIRITEKDTVAVALEPLSVGECVCGVTLREAIPAGHKVSLVSVACGEDIIKYGAPIGHALADIPAGTWVHTHNLATNLSDVLTYTYQPIQTTKDAAKSAASQFRGFRRRDGRVGIRNEIWIIPTVGCVNSTAQTLAREAAAFVCGSVDGVYAFPHPYGCSQLGCDHRNTQAALAGLVHHPNAGGVLVLGLGCENNNIDEFRRVLGDVDEERVRFLVCQEAEDEIADGLAILRELCGLVSADERTPCPVSVLTVGLKRCFRHYRQSGGRRVLRPAALGGWKRDSD